MKLSKGGYIPPSVLCGKNLSCKKEIKEELPDIFLSNNEIVELSPANTEIGLFTSGIDEIGFFSLHSDTANLNDNKKFIIKDNKLKSKNILYYAPGVTYKVTVKYIGPKHYKQKDFIIVVTNSQDNAVLSLGQQVQVLSTDNTVELTFDNVATAGEVTFRSIEDQAIGVMFNEISTNAELNGDITVSFNNENINPSSNPVIFHIRYDDELNEAFYENITTEVIEGKITGVVRPITAGIAAQAGMGGPSLGVFTTWFTAPPEAWGSAPAQGWGSVSWLNPFPPCPGNQTRSGFTYDSEDGILSPGGVCGCWVDTGVTAENIIMLLSFAGAARSLAFGFLGALSKEGLKGAAVASLNMARSALEGTLTTLADLRFRRQLLIDKVNEYIKRAGTSLAKATDEQRRELFLGKAQSINKEIISGKNLQEIQEKAVKEAEKLLKEAIKGEAVAKTGALVALGQAAAYLASAYALINSIGVDKECPNDWTLRPISCQCCPDCENGKVFTNPSGCNCACPQGKDACTNTTSGVEGCYEPCGARQIRTGDCQCLTIISNCLGNCYYSYDYFLNEWHLSGNGDCADGCECPSDEYVNSNDQSSGGCSDAADCSDCAVGCIRL